MEALVILSANGAPYTSLGHRPRLR